MFLIQLIIAKQAKIASECRRISLDKPRTILINSFQEDGQPRKIVKKPFGFAQEGG